VVRAPLRGGAATFGLIYHDIAPAGDEDRVGFPGPAAARYKLDPAEFDAHLDAIQRAGVELGLIGAGSSVALTFDDGGASAIAIADRLEAHGWRGHFFITTGRLGTPGFLSAEQVAELSYRGHDIGSHSESHPTYMGSLTRAQLHDEWRRSGETLAEIIGRPPLSAAVPGGFVSPAVVEEAASAGYRLLMTSQPTTRPQHEGKMLIVGRYTIWRRTSPARAAAYVRGAPGARTSLWIAWQLKNAPKRLSPRAYELVRQAWAARRR
jgi:peptidoglycan/xylan/chitin deacetylase (PgdA/CDA1 family)